MELERLLARTSTTGLGCWVWNGPLDKDGYGRCANGQLAHRAVWKFAVGPIPEDLEVDHVCRMRACVNPDHLELVTHVTNVRRAAPFRPASLKTHCANGHEYTDENTYTRTASKNGGKRQCRACNRESAKRYRERRSA